SHPEFGFQVSIRRVITSQSWAEAVGSIAWPDALLPSHPLWDVIPAGSRKMSSPRQVMVRGQDGARHKCVAEAFKTPYNTFILIQASSTLVSRIVIPSSSIAVKALTSRLDR